MLEDTEVLYEDPRVLVLNKATGVPLLRDRTGIPDLWSALKQQMKPYLVHRLDKGTSGVLLIAKTQSAQSQLTRYFEQRRVQKYYTAIVNNDFSAGKTQHIDLPLCKGRKSRYRVAGPRAAITHAFDRYTVNVDREGLDALTKVRKISTALPLSDGRSENPTSWLALKPTTGRTHQLRVHLSWIGYPILGDHLYGPPDNQSTSSRLMLHCHRLIVPGLPTLQAPLPLDWYG